MIQRILVAHNQRLLRSLSTLVEAVTRAGIPSELEPYRSRIQQACSDWRSCVEGNLNALQSGQTAILEEILSNTQVVTREVSLLSDRLVIPILRATEADRLSLHIIGWMHRTHPDTKGFAPAFADGSTAVWPIKLPIYFLPCIDRQSLLFQPLLFHEFGHLQYSCHQAEMDDLVGELQREIAQLLLPPSMRNDRHAEEQANRRQIIADTWYRWTQEIFCDATGLIMGGPSFLYAFSAHLRMIQRGDYSRLPTDLQLSSHPVTWLRIRLLAERAHLLGFGPIAQAIADEWSAVAEAMGVTEEYYGYFDPAIGRSVMHVVDDMLVESDPRACTPEEAACRGWDGGSDSLVSLLNRAWQIYLTEPDRYLLWESEMIHQLLMAETR